MIQLFHVNKPYGPEMQALEDVSFQIKKGEFVYLTGPSGAGKSTLLKLMFCAEQPTSGQLLINGRNIARLKRSSIPYLRRNIGVVFQDFQLLARRSVQDNVAIGLEIIGAPKAQIQRKTFGLLKQVGLAHKRNFPIPKLSGGEQQRVAIARALANEPQLLLADEPTGNLDAEQSAQIIRLIEEANARGTTVIVATHDPTLLKNTTRRIIHLEQGRLATEQRTHVH